MTSPANDTGFAEVYTLSDLPGCYRNLGDDGDDEQVGSSYLSRLLWPSLQLGHASIEHILVAKNTENSVAVKALHESVVVYESVFTEGVDFNLERGRLNKRSAFQGSLAGEPGNVLIGLGYESETIGMDLHGNGRVKHAGSFVGTGFVIFPLAIYSSAIVRYEKLGPSCSSI